MKNDFIYIISKTSTMMGMESEIADYRKTPVFLGKIKKLTAYENTKYQSRIPDTTLLNKLYTKDTSSGSKVRYFIATGAIFPYERYPDHIAEDNLLLGYSGFLINKTSKPCSIKKS